MNGLGASVGPKRSHEVEGMMPIYHTLKIKASSTHAQQLLSSLPLLIPRPLGKGPRGIGSFSREQKAPQARANGRDSDSIYDPTESAPGMIIR